MYSIHQTHASVKLSVEPRIHESSHIENSFAGEWASIGPGNSIIESRIGSYTYTMDEVTINYTEVGKFTSIASHVCLNPVNHPMDRVSQHHMTYRRTIFGFADTDDDDIFNWRRENRVTVGHDVWIGHGAIVMKGVRIGTGAVIGSGSVVTKDVEPYMVVAGVPAKPIKTRFPREIVDSLLQMAWWDWPRELLEERFLELNDIQSFIKKYG
ncbi:DapH/DapD/GlmU-related protein [Paenibacillus radicis (ex Xue et al. 2023)]|uniref:Acetyltransferase n=1 Tax=Paenibacillus radicis (ex Xue et al. 2023) TaxID=2972489 RepID=A0ABT1YC09_9BACL|nr:DapH/DapD/GlmU-related protein [Paenibacillus radicis (ex Xue et al. 2023)]MCR8630290.1 acetyltransferase [Paenibacillus radicis (ex Xue et al. 2023)]